MKTFATLFALFISAFFLCHHPVMAGETVKKGESASFILVNHTGAAIVNLRLSPSLADKWGDNLVGDKEIANQSEVEIPFTVSDKTEFWDLQTTDPKNETTEWPGLPLTEDKKVILSFEDGEPVVTYQ